MFKQLLLSMLLAAVATAAAAGCGGDSSGSDDAASASPAPTTVTSSSLSKSAFLKQGNAICTKGAKQVETALANLGKLKGKAAEAAARAFVPTFVAMVESVIGEIQELGAPSGDEAEVEAILSAMQQAGKEGSEDPEATIEDLARSFKKPDKLASDYGLTSCAY